MAKKGREGRSEHKKGFLMDKNKNFNDWYLEVIDHTRLIDNRYPTTGFSVHTPLAAIPEKIMFRMFEDALEKRGHKPVMFPTVIPETLLSVEKEHVEGFEPGVFWITHGGKHKLDVKLALRPTSETAFYHLYKLWVQSYVDLPLKIYQTANVFRHETKMTKPLLRDREFYWIEAHDVFTNAEEAENQVLEDMDITKEVLYNQLGIPFIFFRRPSWDKFAGSVYSYAADVMMPDGKVLQLPSTHYYGTKFSEAFGITFEDEKGKKQFAYQTTFGPAISRIFGALVGIHGDNKGLRFPFSISSTQVVIIPIKNDSEIVSKAKEIHKQLENAKIRVVTDDSNQRPGSKYYYWETRGAPIRIELGSKEVESGIFTIARRDTGEKEQVSESELLNYLKQVDKKILETLKSQAEYEFTITNATNLIDINKALDSKGFARIGLCSMEMDGKPCAEEIYEKTKGGEVRGIWHGKEEDPSGLSCPICGKSAKNVVYVARAH